MWNVSKRRNTFNIIKQETINGRKIIIDFNPSIIYSSCLKSVMQNNIKRKFHDQVKSIITATRSIKVTIFHHMRDRDVTIFFSTHHPSLDPYDG